MSRVWIGVVLLAAVVLACQPAEEPATSSTDEYALIYETMEGVAARWNSGDLEASAVYFAEEFTQMPPGEVARVGLDAVNAVWVGFLEANTDLWEPAITEVQIVGDLAFARGITRDTVTPKGGGEPGVTGANALWIFRRQADGSWPMIFEYWVPKGAARASVYVAPPTLASSPDENAVIYESIERMAETWNARDLDNNLVLFAEEFIQMPPGGDALVGLDTMTGIWRDYLEENTTRWEPSVAEVQVVGDLAFARGSDRQTTTPWVGGETVVTENDSLWVFRRQADGSWLAILEHMLLKEPAGVE